jgi:GntR family transcriptional regulator/MocR family aminotransferase
MRKIPTNLAKPISKPELPLDLTGAHITEGSSSQDRLYQALCHAITGGVAKPGAALPPSRILAKQTGIQRNAVTNAYERLIADGFAVARVGSGTFVAARIPDAEQQQADKAIAIDAPQRGTLALGCTAYRRTGAAPLSRIRRPPPARIRQRASALRRSPRQS